MLYMSENERVGKRLDAKKILPGSKTVITLAINYYHAQKFPQKKSRRKNSPENYGKIARYAYGRDYHKILTKKLKELQKFLQKLFPSARSKIFVDAGPVLEKAFAEKSGLGHIGKNSCLITKEFGSWVFLSEIITTAKLSSGISRTGTADKISNSLCEPKNCHFGLPRKSTYLDKNPPPFFLCGTCTRCIDACPTKAIIAPGLIDARRCLSYLTIENKKSIPKKFHAAMRKYKILFGCDICQEVCPRNHRATPTAHKEFLNPRLAGDHQDTKNILALKSDKKFLANFAGSPLMRAKLKGLKRNAKILG